MHSTVFTRQAAPRPLPPTERFSDLRADKGPKDLSFDGLFMGSGRRALERALKQDKKR